jgi:hypothetical protein
MNNLLKELASKLIAIILFVVIIVFNGYAGDEKQNRNPIAAQDSLTQLASKFYSEGNYRKTLELLALNDSLFFLPNFSTTME